MNVTSKEKYFFNHEWEEWTPQAIECYKINSNCAICSIYKQLEAECFMYKAVSELLRTKGEPNIEDSNRYFQNLDKYENSVMDAIIKHGCRTKQEIMKQTGMSDFMAQTILCRLYLVAGTDGCKYEVGKIKINKFMQYVVKKFGGSENDNDIKQENRATQDVYAEINRNLMAYKKRLHQKRKVQIKIGKNY